MAKLFSITESDFDAIDPFYRVISHDYARRFASISLQDNAGCQVAISWRSDMIDPFLAESPDGEVLWIAVDQGLAAVRLPCGGIAFKLYLPSNALDLQLFGDLMIVVCETNLILINTDGSLRAFEGLVDIPDSVKRSDDQLFVTYLNGQAQTFQL